MSDKNRDNGFAQIVISGSEKNDGADGFAIPPKNSGRYSGKGAYPAREKNKKAEEELLFYEEKLGLAKKFDMAQIHAKEALKLCESNADTDTIKKEILLLLESVG